MKKNLSIKLLALFLLLSSIFTCAAAQADGVNTSGGAYWWDIPGLSQYKPDIDAINASYPYHYLVGKFCTVTADSGNMRSDAGIFCPRVGTVLKGETFLIHGIKVDYNGHLWYLINNVGLYGFISSGIAAIH